MPVASTGDSDKQPGEELWVGEVTSVLTWGEKEESSGRAENQARDMGVDGAGGLRGWDGNNLGKRSRLPKPQ